MTRGPSWRWGEVYLPLILSLLAFALLAVTAIDPGLSWDEANFLGSMGSYARWYGEMFSGLLSGSPGEAFSRELITERWRPTHENPPLALIMSTVTAALFQDHLGLLTATRMAGAISFGLLALTAYKLVSRIAGYLAGTLAALSLAAMPRLVGHSHLATLDVTMALMWILTTYSFYRGTTSWRWAVATGVFFGLALATKLNAVLLPLPLLVWGQFFSRRRVTSNLTSMAFIGPIVWMLSWPWLWHDTLARMVEYFATKVHHAPVPVHYLGITYLELSAPWHYVITMPAVTVPPGITICAAAGAALLARNHRERHAIALLVFSLAGVLAPFLLPGAQKYDGVRLFMPMFPLVACLAGCGMARAGRSAARALVLAAARRRPGNWERRQTAARVIAAALGVLVIGGSAAGTFRTHPYQLSYYNFLIGGLRGAREMGLEVTYWGEALTSSFLNDVFRALPEGSKVNFYPCGSNALRWYQATADSAHRGIRIVLRDEAPDYLVLIWRQGFFDQQLWTLTREQEPIMQDLHDGVPLTAVFRLTPATMEGR